MTHILHPLPQRLAKLLIDGDNRLAGAVERWMDRQSAGRYPFLHRWLDDEGNVEERKVLGAKVCEIVESGNLAELDETKT